VLEFEVRRKRHLEDTHQKILETFVADVSDAKEVLGYATRAFDL
jgi:hypothetical protein